MDAEILFFMTATDQSNFLEMAAECCDSITEKAESKTMLLHVASCHLLFTPSTFEQDTIYAGQLEIRSSSFSEEQELSDQNHAKFVFRKLRNVIKKHYWSRLAYLNKNKKDKLTPSRNYWLGPDAKTWKETDEKKRFLKLSTTSWMMFELGY